MKQSLLHTQGDWSVLIPHNGKLTEARNLYGCAADFHTFVDAVTFADNYPESVVCEFHTKTWENFLSGNPIPACV